MSSRPTDPTKSTRSSPLYEIPIEILNHIIFFLAPEAVATDDILALPGLEPDEQSIVSYQWDEWWFYRHALLALSSTSRVMRNACAPALWSSVAILNGDSMRQFRAVVTAQPAFGHFVKEIYCLTDLTTKHARVKDEDLLEVFTDLLVHTPNLSDLLLLLSPGHYHTLHHLVPAFDSKALIDESLASSINCTGGASRWGVLAERGGASLYRLRSLRIRSLRELIGENGIVTSAMGTGSCACNIVVLLPYLPNLQTLEICAENQDMWPTVEYDYHRQLNRPFPMRIQCEDSFPLLPNLRHLRLYGTQILEPELVALVANCVNLESLVVYFESHCDKDDRIRLPRNMTLNDALLKVEGVLKSLDISAGPKGDYLTHEAQTDPRHRRLTCLPQLSSLRSLSIDFRSLFGPLPFLTALDVEDLSTILPPNVEYLKIICDWGNLWVDALSQRDFSLLLEGIRAYCTTMPLLSGQRKPPQVKLRSITICEGCRATRELSELIAESEDFFQARGIRFAVDGLPARCGPLLDVESDTETEDERLDARDTELQQHAAE